MQGLFQNLLTTDIPTSLPDVLSILDLCPRHAIFTPLPILAFSASGPPHGKITHKNSLKVTTRFPESRDCLCNQGMTDLLIER